MLSDDIVITGRRAIARSYAKINLTLDVLSRRADGYHDIKMIMQTVSLFDLLIIDKTDGEISVSTNLKYLPTNNKNLAYRAAELFYSLTSIRSGAKIIIHKNIPVAAGLAGGSGNCAAVLCALNMLYGCPLSREEIIQAGASLGADVAYCFTGGTQLAEGIGEILTPLPPAPKAHILLVKPPVSVSTAAVYEQIDGAEDMTRPDTDGMIRAIKSGSVGAVADKLSNVMESVTVKLHPVVGGIKKKMIMNGALGAVMSGSGPTVFGIFDDYAKAKRSADSFAMQFRDVYLTSIMN